jgi:hypothetical protein
LAVPRHRDRAGLMVRRDPRCGATQLKSQYLQEKALQTRDL